MPVYAALQSPLSVQRAQLWPVTQRLCMALVQVTQHPEVFFTWGSTFPDKIKFRKLVGIWPLRLKLRADYCRVSRSFEYGCSCKVRCGGRVGWDLSATRSAQAKCA